MSQQPRVVSVSITIVSAGGPALQQKFDLQLPPEGLRFPCRLRLTIHDSDNPSRAAQDERMLDKFDPEEP